MEPRTLFAIVWCFGLLVLAVIDAETGFLPDALTLPLALIGGAAAVAGYGPGITEALLGGVLGGGSFFLLAQGYRKLRGEEGLGGGDVKLMAAAGIWCGPWVLPFLVLFASLTGLLFAGGAYLMGHHQGGLQQEIRFGPFLAGAAAAVYLTPLPFAPF
ncbi:MAG: A24 family peptidase [Pseudomonadota bacterium]